MDPATQLDPVPIIARETGLPERGVRAVVTLFGEGNTVPFIARYRKEATQGLDEVQIRAIEERHRYLGELSERRAAILASIEEQGKLTPELRERILAATTKAAIEDLYLPFKPKRRTRGTIAREKGLEPLAGIILNQLTDKDPFEEAVHFVDTADSQRGVESVEDALQGAKDIVAEIMSEDAEIRAMVRDEFATGGILEAKVVSGKDAEPTKFEPYYDYREPVASVPSHRYLAIRRGEREGVLRVHVVVKHEPLIGRIQQRMNLERRSPSAGLLSEAIEDGLRRLLAPAVENDIRAELKGRSDGSAVGVFAENLRNLLLAAPLGERRVLGIDPGFRTGCKCAVVDATGRLVAHRTIYPTQRAEEAAKHLLELLREHDPFAIAIGNGTGGRETEAFARATLRDAGIEGVVVVQVNEAGASVYSASDIARDEFPELDVTVRGAISIGRRLQDPLAELVKIDPKSIGVGQYQHDVHQPLLKRKLDEVVESCVNHVGVELATASVPLLSRVAGIGPKVAKNIVRHREESGGFRSRADLLAVSGLGPKAFEQAGGFLRLRSGEHPLDASAVHPERYDLVSRMAEDRNVSLRDLIGNEQLVGSIKVDAYVDESVGEPTLRDILDELRKPGRDPRETFEPPQFREDVTSLEDVEPGMVLEGIVTNVTDFGAFVDVGVHQDGLVHVSQLSDQFVKSPADVVKAGDRLRVRVLEVDVARSRISLSARSDGDRKKKADGGRSKGATGAKKGKGGRDARPGKARSGKDAAGSKKGSPSSGGSRKSRPATSGGGASKKGKSGARPGGDAGRSSRKSGEGQSYQDKLDALKRKFNR